MFSGLPVVMGLDLVMGNCMNIIPIFACPISKKVMPKAMLVPKDLQNGKMPICPTHTHHVCKYFFHNIYLTGQKKVEHKMHRHRRIKICNCLFSKQCRKTIDPYTNYLQLQKDSQVMMLSFSQSQSVWWKFFDQIFFLRFGKKSRWKKNLKYSSILQNKGKSKTARLLQIHFLSGDRL